MRTQNIQVRFLSNQNFDFYLLDDKIGQFRENILEVSNCIAMSRHDGSEFYFPKAACFFGHELNNPQKHGK